MNRWWVAFAGASLVLGFLVMGWLAPDVGPAVEVRPPPEPRVVAAASPEVRPPTPRPPPRDPAEDEAGLDEPFTPPTREPRPPAPIDPDQVFEPDLRGLASVAVSRRDRMVGCIRDYQQQTGEEGYDGRFTVKITVSPGEDEGVVGTEIVNGPDDAQLQSCLDESLADARFGAPDHDFSMMWPIPLPKD